MRRVINDLLLRMDRSRPWQRLTQAERHLWVLGQLESETLNGTVHQYLANSSGDNFAAAVKALEEIGDSTCLTAMQEVAAWFPGGIPSHDRAIRNGQLEALSASRADFEIDVRAGTSKLEAAFPEMRCRLVEYLRQHAEDLA